MKDERDKLEVRVKTVEEAVQLLTGIALRADKRMDASNERMHDYETALANLTVKLEALADAQIHTEESLSRMEAAHSRMEEAHRRLAESQAHSDERLNALIDIIRKEHERRNGQTDGPQ